MPTEDGFYLIRFQFWWSLEIKNRTSNMYSIEFSYLHFVLFSHDLILHLNIFFIKKKFKSWKLHGFNWFVFYLLTKMVYLRFNLKFKTTYKCNLKVWWRSSSEFNSVGRDITLRVEVQTADIAIIYLFKGEISNHKSTWQKQSLLKDFQIKRDKNLVLIQMGRVRK
jgi:hypothetical protein